MIWVIGCNGMLGKEVVKQVQDKKLPWVGTDKEVDITDYHALESFTKSIETASYFPSSLSRSERLINWVINCAAYTDVENAEEERDEAKAVNETGSLNIARICRKIGAKLIHMSTDYVFDGTNNTPYTEEDSKNPVNFYGSTKSAGEDAIQKEMNTYYIIRTSWLYGFEGKNFVYRMINSMSLSNEVNVINDQTGTPTNAEDLASIILKFIDKSTHAAGLFGKNSIPSYGIYNFTNGGQTTWYEFAKEIYKLGHKHGKLNTECNIVPCKTEDYTCKAKRPAYSVLNKDKICSELKIKLPDWKVSLEKFIKSNRFNCQ